MNNSDGFAAAAGPPFSNQRPPTSSSNSSDNEKLVLTSKVNRRKTNLGKKKNAAKDGLTPVDLPRQKTFAPGENANVRKVKKTGWANDNDDNDSELL